jgi:ParB-like chromosome segregation protein Spo0J
MKQPTILLKQPEPRITQKQFHGKKLLVWEGLIPIKDVKGWVGNPRLDLELKRFQDSHVGRQPDDEEVYSVMKNVRAFKLKELADDIRINGVRQSIVVTCGGKLLDGNRRYYASRLILDTTKNDDPARSDFENIPAWVLDASCTEDDEDGILVQENFYPALKVEWPDYVKAQRIYQDLQSGDSAKAVAQRYNWSPAKINETKRIMELITEFIVFATSAPGDESDGLSLPDIEAERIAAENYQFFNEAQKSFRHRLDTDIDFKQQFFKWIFEEKFSSFAEVRIAEAAWDNEKARKLLMSNDPKAGSKAKALIDYERNFEKETIEVEQEIDDFVETLAKLTTAQKKEISPAYLKKLESALNTVVGMIKSAKTSKG